METIKIKDIIDSIEEVAPLHWQEDYDNSGLTLGDVNQNCTGVFVCLDLSEEIIEKAINQNCNLIISHHPIIFKGLKKIDYTSSIGKILIKAIKDDIALYAVHTNIDNALNGVNGILAQKIGLLNIKPLNLGNRIENENWLGAGAIGELPTEIKEEKFYNHLKNVLNLKSIKYNSIGNKKLKKVAICGGSGSFLIKDAIRTKADIFLTGDIKYHDFLDNENNIILADIGHFESEQFIKERIISIISRKFCNFAPLISDDTPNRVKYL